ncbi:putative ADP-ribosylation factor-binding protein C25H2.16c, partial [Protomyces lactucae-debilis]
MVSLDDINAYSRPQSSLPKGTAHLYSYINRATSPSNFEPNLALNLEIADLINSKKGNMPRDAAVAIVHKINSLNPITSLLAIALLDMLVKNCGYAFHLQIATKEFLNELVRRFPERPPPRPSRVQFRVLELLEQWRQTLCSTSKYKDDMGYIRDMHRLLHYKGYDFPEINAGAASVLNPNDSLKSASEMEAEDRAAHSAKLQELIRRGTPADLKEANQLMKVMAGFDQNKVDYRAKAAEETDHIRRKASLLVEMLSGLNEADVLADGDIYQELADSIRNAQPKLQKMCEDESEDQEAVGKLFELNDSINSIVTKYDLLRKGDFAAAQRVP